METQTLKINNMKKYRIVADEWAGYEVQIWRLWWPFWVQCGDRGKKANTHPTIQDAENYAKKHSMLGKEVKRITI